jgi:hypothetical protein
MTEQVAMLNLDPAAITGVVVTGVGGQQVSLLKQGNAWNITAPITATADTLRVSQVITDFAGLTATRVFTPTEQDLSAYGLDMPSSEIILSGANGVLARLRLGVPNPTNNATYVQRGDSPVIYLVNNFELDQMRNWLLSPPLPPTPMPTVAAPTGVPAAPTGVPAAPTVAPPTGAPAAPTGAPAAPTVAPPTGAPAAPTAAPPTVAAP